MLIPLLNDCVRVLDEAGVTPEDLDTAMTNGAGWPMGPCALVDLVGIDVHVHASEALYEKLREQRMAPPAAARRDAERGPARPQGGRGFYTYDYAHDGYSRRTGSIGTAAGARRHGRHERALDERPRRATTTKTIS